MDDTVNAVPNHERFLVERRVGVGGMGEVYRAIDQHNGAVVALKIALSDDEQHRDRALVEAGALACLDHPAIVRLVASGIGVDGHAYLAMEWLEGEDLGARLRRGSLSLRDTAELGVRMADGLSAAHAVHIVHRDLKPSNVFLPNGDVHCAKLVDFGIARVGRQRLTQTGALLGTPGYMAPEQARGDSRVGCEADMFALGTVLFECIAGRPAFVGDHAIAILAKVLFDEPPQLSSVRTDLPEEFVEFIGRLLAKTPAARPTARQALEFFRAFLLSQAMSTNLALDHTLRETPRPAPEYDNATVLPLSAEQRLVCVLVIRNASDSILSPERSKNSESEAQCGDTNAEAMEAVKSPKESEAIERLRAIVAPLGGRAERLLDGTLIASWTDSGIPRDLAARGARAALLACERFPGHALALGSGLAATDSVFRFGSALDRAVAALGKRDASGVFIDDLTAGFLDDRFTVESSVHGHELTGRRSMDGGETRRLAGRTSPCVGRDRELRMLADLLDECVDAPRAQAAVITAQPGMGKSRLCSEMLRVVQLREDVAVWSAEADEFGAGSPFGLVGSAVRSAIGVKHSDSMDERRRKLTDHVARCVHEKERIRVAAFLGEMAGVPFPSSVHPLLATARHEPRVMVEQVRRAFIDFVTAETEEHAILLILEDLHWSDPPSIKLFTAAMSALRDRPVMLLGFSRPEASDRFPEFWTMRELQEIRLGGLAKRAAMKLAQNALPNADDSLIKRLVERADGNALYLEELVRAAASGRENDLPEGIAAMVQARFAALPADERRVLRAASVFGGAFWHGSVAGILGGGKNNSTTIAPSVFDSLVDLEILERRAESRFPEDKEFVFRHALLREGAYALLTDTDRASCHVRAGEWLEKQSFAEERPTPDSGDGSRKNVERSERGARGAETGAARIAQHFELGGATSRAVEWLGRAASRALQAGDPAGATDSAARGLELFGRLEDVSSRSAQELHLRIAHYSALMLTRGYTVPEALVSLRRAEELCPRDAPERYSVIHGLWMRHLAAGDPWSARAFAAELLALATASKPSGVVTAHVALGMTCVFLGEHHAAREHLEAAINLFDREAHPEASLMLGADIEVFASCYLAMTYWALGLVDQGLSTLTQAVELAEKLAHPFSRTSAASFAAVLFQNRREPQKTSDYAARSHALAIEYGFQHYVVQSTILMGWASAKFAATAESVSELTAAINTRRAGGGLIAIPHFLTLLVDVQLQMGLVDDALQTLDEALAITNKTGERLYVPVLYQLMGEAFIARGRPGDMDCAEDVLLRACEVAHYQNSLMMELRASVSLARYWRTVGNGREGCQRVADVLARFTEGFDSRDVQEARTLLEECKQ